MRRKLPEGRTRASRRLPTPRIKFPGRTVSSKIKVRPAMTLAALFAIASAGFVAPGSLSISTACSRRGGADMLFGRKAAGGDLAAVGHEDAVEVTLTGALSLSNRQQGEQPSH